MMNKQNKNKLPQVLLLMNAIRKHRNRQSKLVEIFMTMNKRRYNKTVPMMNTDS